MPNIIYYILFTLVYLVGTIITATYVSGPVFSVRQKANSPVYNQRTRDKYHAETMRLFRVAVIKSILWPVTGLSYLTRKFFEPS